MLTILLASIVLWLGAQTGGEGREGLVMVSYRGEDAVGLIDPNTGAALTTVAVGKDPHEIALSRDRTRAYIATTGGAPGERASTTNAIGAVDVPARSALAPIDLRQCESPHDVRVSTDGAIVWVACAPNRAVVEIDARSGRQIAVWGTRADGGWFLAVTPDGNKIYVPHLEGKRVSVIDRARSAVATVLEGGPQSGIDVSPDGRAAWVIDHEQRIIHVIDTTTDRATARVALRSSDFGRLRFTPDGARVVVVQGRSLTIFATATRTLTGEVTLPSAGKVLDISPAGDRAVVSHPAEDLISIVDLKSGAVKSIRTGKTPDGVAWVR